MFFLSMKPICVTIRKKMYNGSVIPLHSVQWNHTFVAHFFFQKKNAQWNHNFVMQFFFVKKNIQWKYDSVVHFATESYFCYTCRIQPPQHNNIEILWCIFSSPTMHNRIMIPLHQGGTKKTQQNLDFVVQQFSHRLMQHNSIVLCGEGIFRI